MLADIHKSESNQSIDCITMGVIEFVAVFSGVTAFCAGAFIVELFKAFGVTVDRRKKPGICSRGDVEGMAHFLIRFAVLLQGAFIFVEDALAFAVFAHCRTFEEMGAFIRQRSVVAHTASARTKGRAIRVKGDLRIAFEVWVDRL